MARYVGAKCRLCRREREKLFLKGARCYTDKCAFERRKYPPGVHGPKRSRKLSVYGLQLREKQKVKRIYGILEGQFRKSFETARKMKGSTGENLLSLLERRLDNVVYQLGFAQSRTKGRQLVRHGHVRVNSNKVDIPSYIVKAGDVIGIRDRSKKKAFIVDSLESRDVSAISDWLSLDPAKKEGRVQRVPDRSDITHPINERLIVELYSK
jgi:small subunit ribosomal protein S4